MTYLVMEVHISYCVVVNEIGSFIKVANLRYEVGQYVENIIELKAPEKVVNKFNVAALGSIAACFLLFFSLYWYNYMLSFGMIYISVNPDVQIEISRRDTVVGLTGLNEDGELLVSGYEHRGKHTANIAVDLMDRAIEYGFLSDGNTVVISIDAPNDKWFVENGILLRQQLETHLAGKAQVKIIIEAYDAEKWSTAPNSQLIEENTPITTPPATQSPTSDYSNDNSYTSDNSGYNDSAYGNSNNNSGDNRPVAKPTPQPGNNSGDSRPMAKPTPQPGNNFDDSSPAIKPTPQPGNNSDDSSPVIKPTPQPSNNSDYGNSYSGYGNSGYSGYS